MASLDLSLAKQPWHVQLAVFVRSPVAGAGAVLLPLRNAGAGRNGDAQRRTAGHSRPQHQGRGDRQAAAGIPHDRSAELEARLESR